MKCKTCGTVISADSEVAIDEEWLRSVGFETEPTNTRWRLGVLVRWFDGEWSVAAGSHTAHIPKQPKTRGDVRHLARALGIELATE